MGNVAKAGHGIACGHTNSRSLRVSLLADRLSEPTAEMVEALLFLQGRTLQLQDLAKHSATSETPMSRSGTLIAAAFCIIFGLCSEDDPRVTVDYVSAFFGGALQQPQDILKQMLSLRAQSIPMQKVMRIGPLMEDADLDPETCKRVQPFGEILQHLAMYIRGLAECAEIYNQIQEAANMGLLDKAQAASLSDSDGTDSDQHRAMLSALGSVVGSNAATTNEELPRTTSSGAQLTDASPE